jgi:hypothetical protein
MRIAGSLHRQPAASSTSIVYNAQTIPHLSYNGNTMASRRAWHDIYDIHSVRLIVGSYRRLNNTKAVSKVII